MIGQLPIPSYLTGFATAFDSPRISDESTFQKCGNIGACAIIRLQRPSQMPRSSLSEQVGILGNIKVNELASRMDAGIGSTRSGDVDSTIK